MLFQSALLTVTDVPQPTCVRNVPQAGQLMRAVVWVSGTLLSPSGVTLLQVYWLLWNQYIMKGKLNSILRYFSCLSLSGGISEVLYILFVLVLMFQCAFENELGNPTTR